MRSFLLYVASAVAMLTGPTAVAQIGVGTAAPNAKAALDISSTSKGLLIPRLDSAQRVAIASPPDGLMVFQKNGRRGVWYAFGGTWVYIPDAARAVRATNGLNSPAAGTVGLGGTLTQPTLINTAANTLTLRSTYPTAVPDQQATVTTATYPLTTPQWQSLTTNRTGELQRLSVVLNVATAGNLEVKVLAGEGTAGAVLSTQVVASGAAAPTRTLSVTLPTPVSITPGKYTIVLTQLSGSVQWRGGVTGGYSGGRASISPGADLAFTVFIAPTWGLAVGNGEVYLTRWSGPAMLMADVDGSIEASTSVYSEAGNLVVSGAVRMGYTTVVNDFNIGGNSYAEYKAHCPPGMRVLGGGGGHRDFNSAANDIRIHYTGPDPSDQSGQWRVIMENTSGSGRAVQVYCTCARIDN